MNNCMLCNEPTEELCQDGVCRPCHKSVTWEECCTKTDTARRMLELGHDRERILKLYPEAKI